MLRGCGSFDRQVITKRRVKDLLSIVGYGKSLISGNSGEFSYMKPLLCSKLILCPSILCGRIPWNFLQTLGRCCLDCPCDIYIYSIFCPAILSERKLRMSRVYATIGFDRASLKLFLQPFFVLHSVHDISWFKTNIRELHFLTHRKLSFITTSCSTMSSCIVGTLASMEHNRIQMLSNEFC